MSFFDSNNFVFADGNNFVFADGNNFVFAETTELSQNATDLINYYTNLLIIQYHDKPKAKATVEALIQALVANGVFFDVQSGYNINTAVGVQLDVLGKYIGLDRFYRGQVLEGYFSFTDYDEFSSPPPERIGFADYTDFDTKEGNFLQYKNLISSTFKLPDEDYRLLLKLKIILNNSNFSHKEIDDAIYLFFGTNLRAASDGNMVMSYFFNPDQQALIEVAKNKELLPKPMGVGIDYLIPDLGYFGFTNYEQFDNPSSLTLGFSDYTDYDTKEGNFLQYSNLIS